MLFNSVEFLFFFIIVIIVFFTIPHRYRWVLLLVASYYFYMCWNVKYILLIVISTLVDYFCGMRMSRCPQRRQRTKYLILSLSTNLGLLFAFKYFNFIADSLNFASDAFSLPIQVPYLDVLLPVGISFYTFQTLSYTIDVYRGKIKQESHLGIFALYVSFFPQLVAGPIERASRLLPQFYRRIRFNEERIVSGLRLMMWGMFKKVVVANRLALYVDTVYGNVDIHSGLTLLVGTYMFAFQIYCDFSGYSDIAIGAARVLGYDLMKNFERPYFSSSIPEFWRRWHISLSTWFRDYLYIPLGGNRKGISRTYVNLFIVFLVSGMWHGANWTFLIWGAMHGVFVVFSKYAASFKSKLRESFPIHTRLLKFYKVFITFHLVCFSWIFFRANSIGHAGIIVRKIFSQSWTDLFIPALDQFVYSISAIALLLFVDVLEERFNLSVWGKQLSPPIRWTAYIGLLITMLLIGVFNESQFIYFQF